MAKLFLLSSIGPRLPVVASVVAHAAIVVAAVGGQGHGNGVPRAHDDERTIDVEAPVPDEPPPVPETHAHVHALTYASHTHPYPLPPGHDDHPHDPSIDHRHPAAASAVLAAPDQSLPRFSMVLGSSTGSPGGVTSTGDEDGHGPGRATPSGGPEEEEEPAVSVPAHLVSSVQPEYPAAARAGGLEADVPLEIVVDPGGRVVEWKVLRHAGHGFDEAACEAIRTYRFAPARHEGAPVRARMQWTVSFRLE